MCPRSSYTTSWDASGKDLLCSYSVELGVRELIAVTEEAPVATRITPAISTYALHCTAKYITEDLFPLNLHHKPGPTRHIVIEHDRGFIGIVATSNRHVQIGVRNLQCIGRTQQDSIGNGVRIPLATEMRKLKAHDIRNQFMAKRESLQHASAFGIRR